jgi:predicted ATPase/DNA-binding CsgD family transcriptional regulator
MINSLPLFLAPLIGREQELTTLEQLLRHPSARLVTLTGPGGIGKTRLAVAVASMLVDVYPGAITFLSLIPITDPGFVLPGILAALGIQNEGDASQTTLERIIRFIHEKPHLLILDNFEHVIEAASALPELLAVCPNLKIIATSRQNLHLRGEQEFAVPLLGLPDIERLAQGVNLTTILPRYPAVGLFLDRMRAIQVGYEPGLAALRAIAEICVRLDGLPLAIELAAPRTRMFSPEQLLAQLGGQGEITSLKLLTGGARDLPARQRTLSRTIQWSYDLLSGEEKRVFRTISIFSDTFTLQEAEKLFEHCDGDQLELPLTDMMTSLLDKNLLRPADSKAEPRFRLLATLQEFGRAEVTRLGEMPRLQAAHAATYLDLAEAAAPALYTQEQIEITTRLRRDLENLRHALRWSLEQEESAQAARFGAALWRFWLLGGLLSEGQKRLQEILAHLGYDLDSDEIDLRQANAAEISPAEIGKVAELFYGLGYLTYQRSGSGRPEVARWLSQSRELYLQIGDRIRAALASTALARTIIDLHEDLALSQRLLEESYEILQLAEHKTGLGENLHAQAQNLFFLNRSEEAAEVMAHSLALLRETGNIYELAHATKFAADLASGRIGGYEEVRRCNAEAAEMFAALGNATEAALAKAIQGVLTGWIDGDWAGALELVDEGQRVAREHGNERTATYCMAMASWAHAGQGNYGEAKSIARKAIRTAYDLSDHLALRTAFIGLANAERLDGDYAAAVATVSALMSYRMRYHTLAASRGNSIYMTSLSQMKRDLASPVFEQAWSSGPRRLAELLPQPNKEDITWPLAPVPETDSANATPEKKMPVPLASNKATHPASPSIEPLTAREKEILEYLVLGMTDPQIAERLVISPRTVHAHLRNIYGKLGVSTRTAATRLVLENRLV